VNDKDARFNRRLALLVLASFTIFASAVVLRVGIGATPYDTRDSAGRAMGFNDPLSAEHYAIILRNFSPADLLKTEYVYEWVLFAAHIIGGVLLLTPAYVGSRLIRWYFIAQPDLFPLGVPALLYCPLLIAGCLTGPMDREGFIDIPFIVAVSHPVWIVTSLGIAFAIRKQRLGSDRTSSRVSQPPGGRVVELET
jgi:hypothetical protein